MKVSVNGWIIGDKYWKKTHKGYYCVLVHPDRRREDHRLDPDANKAEELRANLITAIKREGRPSADYGVRDLCFLFLDYVKANNAKKTYTGYLSYLKSFCATIPATLKVRDLKLAHIQNWLTRKYPATGNTNTRRGAVVCLKRVFNWAVNDMEFFDRNPLTKMKSPPAAARATFLSKDQWATVLSHYKTDDPFYDFLKVMLRTGCRPQEARIMGTRQIDWKAKKAVFADGEVPGKKGVREILLTDEAVAILRKWTLKYPDGPAMRNEDGNPWTSTALNSRFVRLRKKLPFRAHCYLARHSVATDMLLAGASTGAVSAVLGHRDATMVLKTYGKHIERREDHLRECLTRGTG